MVSPHAADRFYHWDPQSLRPGRQTRSTYSVVYFSVACFCPYNASLNDETPHPSTCPQPAKPSSSSLYPSRVTLLHHLAILIPYSNTSCTSLFCIIFKICSSKMKGGISQIQQKLKWGKKKKRNAVKQAEPACYLNVTLFEGFLDLYTLYQIQAFFARELFSTLNWFYEKPASHSLSLQLPVSWLWLPLPWPWAAVLLGKAAGGPPWCFSSPPAECHRGDGPSETQSLLQYGPWDYFQKQSAGSQ